MSGSSITRDQSLNAKPLAATIVHRVDQPDGSAKITILVESQGFMRWALRAPKMVEHRYELDALGLWVMAMCDGQKTVRYIIQRFTKDHGVNEHEAEQAVLTFLRTLVRKGLVKLIVSK